MTDNKKPINPKRNWNGKVKNFPVHGIIKIIFLHLRKFPTMKTIFLIFSFLIIHSSINTNISFNPSNCSEFYLNDNHEKITFKGKIISKKKLKKRFIIKIKQNDGDIFNLNLYPNKIGKEIYDLIKLDDIVQKSKDEYGFILISKIKNSSKNPKVIVFNKLCSEE